MKLVRLGIVHPREMSREARLELLGIEELLGQEGIPFSAVPADEEPRRAARSVSLLLAMDHGSLCEAEERGLARLAASIPTVWSGIPRAQAHADLLRALGLSAVRVDDSAHLRLLRHPLTVPCLHDNERTLRMKFVAHLHADLPPGGSQVAETTLADGTSFGPAVYTLEGPPRRVVFTFPVGQVYAQKTSRYTDGEHLDQNDFPICTIVDVLRGLLRDALRWASGEAVLARTYYWPFRGTIARGLFSTTHDLCGYSAEGVRFIRRICEAQGIRTTFFDFHPFRLKPGEAGSHDVCLHAPDATSYAEIVSQKKELEDLQGRAVRGWRRDGQGARDDVHGLRRAVRLVDAPAGHPPRDLRRTPVHRPPLAPLDAGAGAPGASRTGAPAPRGRPAGSLRAVGRGGSRALPAAACRGARGHRRGGPAGG